jgi:hypothetical protein
MRVVQIPIDIDRRFRAALLEGSKAGGHRAQWHIRNALENGPSRGGVAESIAYFGDRLDALLKMTAMVVDGMEITVPGFKTWLVETGFGNDKTMIKGFVKLAEHVNAQGSLLPDAKRAFLH